MRLTRLTATLKLEIDVTKIVQFFPYRTGPRFKTFIAVIQPEELAGYKLHDEFDKSETFKIDNHISWLQEDGLLYVYTDGRLNIGIPELGTRMFS